MATGFEPLKTGDPVVDRVLQQLKKVIGPIASSPMVGARLAVDEKGHHTFLVTTSFQNIPHGLDREVTGWIAVSPDALGFVWEDGPTMLASAELRKKFIRVRASAAVNCKFLVF